MLNAEKIKAVVLGHALADAMGVPAEFKSREELKSNPITGPIGYGTYSLPAGTWSDDTSMSLCALDVLKSGECDFKRIMHNFMMWNFNSHFTASDNTFDVGTTCSEAICNYALKSIPPLECGIDDEHSNGNGSLMRIYPFVLFLLKRDSEITKEGVELIFSASALTHAHMRSKIGCGIYSFVLEALINSPSKESVFSGLWRAEEFFGGEEQLKYYSRLFEKDFAKTKKENIKSSGYVVHSLEAALWCLLTTNSYSECILRAVNLGSDTDTVAAIAGSLAGALYGYNKIPTEWLNTLLRRKYIEELCDEFANKNFKQ